MFKKISTQVSNLAIQTIEYRDYLVVFIIYQETMTVLYTILMQILKKSCNLNKEKCRIVDEKENQTTNVDSENVAARADIGKDTLLQIAIFDPVSIGNTYTDIVLVKYFCFSTRIARKLLN